MTLHFVDSSALTKLFLIEFGSDAMLHRYYSEETLTVSRLALVEVRSVIARLARARDISASDAVIAEKMLNMVSAKISVVSIDEAVCSLAQALVARHELRTLDSLQLATALLSRSDAVGEFICSDHDLLKAAMAEGFNVFDPSIEDMP